VALNLKGVAQRPGIPIPTDYVIHAPGVERNQSTSICKAHFNLKPCRQATQIGLSPQLFAGVRLTFGQSHGVSVARSLRHSPAKRPA
jgi:hypothetical protein